MKKHIYLTLALLPLLLPGLNCKKPDPKTLTPPASVNYKITGIGFSPYENGQDPNNNVQISDAQLDKLTSLAAPYTGWIRTYGSTDGLQDAGRIAKSKGLKVAAGAWLSSDASANAAEISNVIAMANSGNADMVIVGSEVLLRGDLSPAALIAYIKEVRAAIPAGIPVTTADVYESYLNNPSIIDAVDVLCVHIYPFWEGQSFACSMYFINAVYDRVLAQAKGKKVWIGETGWPSAGAAVGSARPSPANAAGYFLNFVSWAKSRGVDYFYFEFFDEAWKAPSEGVVGSNWGIFTANGAAIKPGMMDVFNGQTAPSSNWSLDTAAILADKPSITFTSVPPLGSTSPLAGSTTGVVPSDYSVLTYIFVDNGWWVKPYANQPLSALSCDGTFQVPVNTGGDDGSAHIFRVYIVPNSYSPPVILGGSLPNTLAQAALVWKEVTR